MGLRRYSAFDPPRPGVGLGVRLGQVAIWLAIFWFVGFLGFAAAIPRQPGAGDLRADGIVVLTGGSDRLAEGFRLLQEKRAGKMLVSGVAPGLGIADILAGLGPDRAPIDEALLACCVTLGHEATSTEENARESRDWILANDLRSVLLVTANYHMNRSLLEFRRALGETADGPQILPYPVFPAEIQDPYWFVKPRLLWLIVGEYHKSIAAWARAWWHDLFGA